MASWRTRHEQRRTYKPFMVLGLGHGAKTGDADLQVEASNSFCDLSLSESLSATRAACSVWRVQEANGHVARCGV